MKFRYLTTLPLVLALLLVSPRSIADDTRYIAKSDAEILHNVKSICVLIEEISPEAQKDGLSKQAIQTDVELRLRQAGIKVIPFDEGAKSSVEGGSTLYVVVNCLKMRDLPVYAYSIDVELEDVVKLTREPHTTVFSAITWDRGSVGSVGALHIDSIRCTVKDMTDAFLNDYLKANPKK